jgi:hypothetical protein
LGLLAAKKFRLRIPPVIGKRTRGFATPVRSRCTASMASTVRTPRILLRSAWQTVNIGDIGHTPGMLRLFADHLPAAEITLWPKSVDRGVREQLLAAFPRLRIAEGELDADGRPDSDALREAFARCDVMVHGSGPGLLGLRHLEAWSRLTGKPYGVCGVTSDPTAFGALGDWEGGTLETQRATVMSLPAGRFSARDEAVLRGAAFLFSATRSRSTT